MAERRTWTPQEKLQIVLEGLRGEQEVADVCRRHGISPTQFYDWKAKLMKSADAIYQYENGKRDVEKEKMQEKIVRQHEVIAEITSENLDLKKKRTR